MTRPKEQIHSKLDSCFAEISPQQLKHLYDHGGRIEVTLGCPEEGIYPFRRAFLHLHCPAAVNAFLGTLFHPEAVLLPARVERHGFCFTKSLLVFGFFQCEEGNFFVSAVHLGPVQEWLFQ